MGDAFSISWVFFLLVPSRTHTFVLVLDREEGERSGGAEQKNRLGPPAVPIGTSALPFFLVVSAGPHRSRAGHSGLGLPCN